MLSCCDRISYRVKKYYQTLDDHVCRNTLKYSQKQAFYIVKHTRGPNIPKI